MIRYLYARGMNLTQIFKETGHDRKIILKTLYRPRNNLSGVHPDCGMDVIMLGHQEDPKTSSVEIINKCQEGKFEKTIV